MIKTSWTDPGVSGDIYNQGVCHCFIDKVFCRSSPVTLILFQPWTSPMMIMAPLMALCGTKDSPHRSKYKSRIILGHYAIVKHAGYIAPLVLVIVVNATIVSVSYLDRITFLLDIISNTTATKKPRIIIVFGSTIVSASATIDPFLYSSLPQHCFVFSLLPSLPFI